MREVEVVPGDLVGHHGGALEGAQALLGHGLVVLMQVDESRHEHAVGVELLLQQDHLLEDLLAHRGESAHGEVVDAQVRFVYAEDGGGLAHLARQDVAREVRRHRLGGGREGGVGDLGARLDEARHGAATTELAVVGVRGQDEHGAEVLDIHVADSSDDEGACREPGKPWQSWP